MLQEKASVAIVAVGSMAETGGTPVPGDAERRAVSVTWETVMATKARMVRNVTKKTAGGLAKLVRERVGIDEWRVWWQSSPQSRSAAEMGWLPAVVEVSEDFEV